MSTAGCRWQFVGLYTAAATVLLAMGLLTALAALFAHLGYRRVPGLLVGIHTTFAVSVVIILTAYTLLV